MEYLVIELAERHRIVTEDGEPMIFKERMSAERKALMYRKALVFPIMNVIKLLDDIKRIAKSKNSDALEEVLSLTDEVI